MTTKHSTALLVCALFVSAASAADIGVAKLSLSERVRLAKFIIVGTVGTTTCTRWCNCEPEITEVIFGGVNTNKVLKAGFTNTGFLDQTGWRKPYILFLEDWQVKVVES